MFGRKKKERKKTVLFVDNDEKILRSIENSLQDESYNQLFAKSAQEALEILQEEEVHVIITDMLMPSMKETDFFKIVKKKYPHIVKVILSEYAEQDSILQVVNQGDIVKFIPKIWGNKEDFRKFILEGIERYNLQSECNTIKQ